jgi:hypothetical protein
LRFSFRVAGDQWSGRVASRLGGAENSYPLINSSLKLDGIRKPVDHKRAEKMPYALPDGASLRF